MIAILAAISVAAYTNIQDRSNDAAIRADLSNIAKKLELAKVDMGRYPEINSEMPEYKLTKSAYDSTLNNAYYCLDKANQVYAFGARSKSGEGFIQTSSRLLENRSISGARTCEAIDKEWGSNETTATLQGYYASSYAATDGWTPHWKWTE